MLTFEQLQQNENTTLTKGLNFVNGNLIVLTDQNNGPYEDITDAAGNIIIEGHDVDKRGNIDPKTINQPVYYKNGNLTGNGKLLENFSRQLFSEEDPIKTRIYEKKSVNNWSFLGDYMFTDASYIYKAAENNRKVFKFKFTPIVANNIYNNRS